MNRKWQNSPITIQPDGCITVQRDHKTYGGPAEKKITHTQTNESLVKIFYYFFGQHFGIYLMASVSHG